jgi:hypothetical protein
MAGVCRNQALPRGQRQTPTANLNIIKFKCKLQHAYVSYNKPGTSTRLQSVACSTREAFRYRENVSV